MKPRRTKLARQWDQLDRDELRGLQLAQLRRFLKESVLPFSKYYGRLFAREGIAADDIRSWEDWARVPFTSKADLLAIPGTAAKTRDFVLIPDAEVLKKRPSTMWKAITRGPAAAKQSLEREYRPILMTSTTGRSSEPVPFLYTQHDLDNLEIAGSRMMVICDSRADWRHLNLFPFAPHLA
ncbi:MAG: phenylacetate--CoA ligase family protein, partial [Verrucomicrobiae bacterium]|nr:phenylacetate--CoA ligase family protein [Verrucomicrobiae bacterium]